MQNIQVELKEYQDIVQHLIEEAFSDVKLNVYQAQAALHQGKSHELLFLPSTSSEAVRWAMAYALLAGGKRIRPVLALATYAMCCRHKGSSVDYRKMAPLVLAIEAVHTYSLVHDDLPAMDNDSLRHGLPTAHVIWNEAKAILVGDALLTFAFETLATLSLADFSCENIVDAISILARLAGHEGMVCGQWRDMTGTEGQAQTKTHLRNILPQNELLALIREKTACLLQAPLLMAASLCGESKTTREQLSLFGENLGIAFQICDDILDTTATTADLGKTVGKDEQTGKQTYVSRYGLKKAQTDLHHYTDLALQALENLRNQGYEIDFLQNLAKWLLKREI